MPDQIVSPFRLGYLVQKQETPLAQVGVTVTATVLVYGCPLGELRLCKRGTHSQVNRDRGTSRYIPPWARNTGVARSPTF